MTKKTHSKPSPLTGSLVQITLEPSADLTPEHLLLIKDRAAAKGQSSEQFIKEIILAQLADVPAPFPPATARPAEFDAVTTEAWQEVYGEKAASPKQYDRLSLANLPAAEAVRIATIAGRVGLPERIAFVCEVTVPRTPGALPEMTFAMPSALNEPLSRLAKHAETPRRGPGAGLAALLGSCGAAYYAKVQLADPPKEEAGMSVGTAKNELENAIAATIGLMRLAEKGGSDDFYSNSPIWMLFLQNANALETAGERIEAALRSERRGNAGLAVKVLQTGSVPSDKTEVTA